MLQLAWEASKMSTGILIPAALGLAFALPAAAATTATNAPSGSQPGAQPGAMNGQQSGQQNAPTISAKLRQSLTQAGFTDVHVMPESFLVRAKDRDGNPVMMVVNPDSVTSVTAVGGSNNATGSSGAGTSHSAAASGNNGTTKE
jgi:hypothetical protein